MQMRLHREFAGDFADAAQLLAGADGLVHLNPVSYTHLVVKKLVAMGYQCRDQVEGICQFARRGGILDIFPPDRSEPVRIEFWDDEIDTMSTFQVDTQRRQDSIEQVTIPPAREVLYHCLLYTSRCV